jgi:hypothetical protein
MPKKGEKLSDEQKAKMAAGRTKTKTPETNTPSSEPIQPVNSPANQEYAELQRQVEELKNMFAQSQALNQAFMAGAQSNGGSSPQVNNGRLVGTVERYSVDFNRYVDPRDRLTNEPRLQRIAFPANYELEWNIDVTSYETKDGVNMKEPKFNLKLHRIIADEDGEPTDMRAKICQLVFFEDPQTAMVVANDNGLSIDDTNEIDFLNEMRYLRMRDWLFECFWPGKVKHQNGIHEEVINGQLVEVFTINTDASEGANIPFSQFNSKKKLRI